jgi:heterodisulfide reductase subunit B2
MATYSYYPGCSLHGMAREYDRSLRLAAGKLGVELKELEDWSCCGSTAAHSTDELLSLSLAARNLRLAGETGLPMLAPCTMCFSRMKITQHALQNPAKRAAVENVLADTSVASASDFGVDVVGLLQAFGSDEMLDAVQAAVVKPLNGLKAVCYYGCLSVRPAEIVHPDSLENPQVMDRLVSRLGADVLDWPFKTECCGGSLALARVDIVLPVVRRLLTMARSVGADCIVTACPMCHSNLDARQKQVNARFGENFKMPIYYVTELMGLAFGYSAHELYIDKHLAG